MSTDRDQWPAYGVGAAFAASSVIHAVRPGVFEAIVPRRLPAPRALVYVSGVAEAVCAYGLFRRRPWAGRAARIASVALIRSTLRSRPRRGLS